MTRRASLLDPLMHAIYGTSNVPERATLTPRQIKDRTNGKRFLELVKVASIVSAISTLFFVAIFPNIFIALLAGVVAFGASEVYKAAENILEILNKAAVERVVRRSAEDLLYQVGKNTFVLGPLIRAVNPNVELPQ